MNNSNNVDETNENKCKYITDPYCRVLWNRV